MPSQGFIKIVQNQQDQAPKLLAKTFVKELVKNGYTEAQVIMIAAEMLACLNKDLCSEKTEVTTVAEFMSVAT